MVFQVRLCRPDRDTRELEFEFAEPVLFVVCVTKDVIFSSKVYHPADLQFDVKYGDMLRQQKENVFVNGKPFPRIKMMVEDVNSVDFAPTVCLCFGDIFSPSSWPLSHKIISIGALTFFVQPG